MTENREPKIGDIVKHREGTTTITGWFISKGKTYLNEEYSDGTSIPLEELEVVRKIEDVKTHACCNMKIFKNMSWRTIVYFGIVALFTGFYIYSTENPLQFLAMFLLTAAALAIVIAVYNYLKLRLSKLENKKAVDTNNRETLYLSPEDWFAKVEEYRRQENRDKAEIFFKNIRVDAKAWQEYIGNVGIPQGKLEEVKSVIRETDNNRSFTKKRKEDNSQCLL